MRAWHHGQPGSLADDWMTTSYGTEYRPDLVGEDETIEVPLDVGDLLVFDITCRTGQSGT